MYTNFDFTIGLIKKKKRIQRDGNLKQLAEIVKELGDMYFETGKYDDALQEYVEQLEVCTILEDKLNIAVAHRMIGEIHGNLGNYEEALKHQNSYLGLCLKCLLLIKFNIPLSNPACNYGNNIFALGRRSQGDRKFA